MERRRSRLSDGPSAKRSRGRVREPGGVGHLSSCWTGGLGAVGAASALFLRGRAAEDAGDPEGALALYAEATAMRDVASDPARLGALIHHMARCSSLLGDAEAAWERYLAAARLFHRSEVKVDLGASLCEAGMLLLGFDPPQPEAIRVQVPHALLLGGVADAMDHAVDTLVGGGLPSAGMAMELHRLLTGLMVLATCAGADHLLRQGALAIHERVVLPLEERHGTGPGTPMGDAKAFSMMFMAIARLWEAVGEQERPDRAGIPPTREEAGALRTLATHACPPVGRPLMLPWFDRYLRDRRGATWATGQAPADMGRQP